MNTLKTGIITDHPANCSLLERLIKKTAHQLGLPLETEYLTWNDSDCSPMFDSSYDLLFVNYENYHEQNLAALFQKILASQQFFQKDCLWIKQKSCTSKISCHQLRYIETSERQLLFHYGQQQITVPGSLSDYLELLPKAYFFRCNTSYIVNLYYIEKIMVSGNRYNLILFSGEEIPLSRTLKKELQQKLEALQTI